MMTRSHSADPTMSPGGRTLSVLAGLALAAASLRPRPNPVLSILALVTGSYLAYRGATGTCPITEAIEEHFGELEPPRGR